MNTIKDFLTKYKKNRKGCWVWNGYKTSHGYGSMKMAGRRDYAHRISFRYFKGEIPKELQIDHLCRNRLCINPDHLELVTSAENTRRGNSNSSINAKKTNCSKGHPFFGSNLILKTKNGKIVGRKCRICLRDFWRIYNKKRKLIKMSKNSL